MTVTTDRLSLDGSGRKARDGGCGGLRKFEGAVTVDGVHGMILIELTVQNGPGEGILGQRGAALTVPGTTAVGRWFPLSKWLQSQ